MDNGRAFYVNSEGFPYARYVADIFYHSELKDKDAIFRQGKFLNQEILNHGHAQVAHWG